MKCIRRGLTRRCGGWWCNGWRSFTQSKASVSTGQAHEATHIPRHTQKQTATAPWTTAMYAPIGTSCSAAAIVASSTSSPLSPLSTAGAPKTVATRTDARRQERRPTRCTSMQRSVPSSLPTHACPVPGSTHSDLWWEVGQPTGQHTDFARTWYIVLWCHTAPSHAQTAPVATAPQPAAHADHGAYRTAVLKQAYGWVRGCLLCACHTTTTPSSCPIHR